MKIPALDWRARAAVDAAVALAFAGIMYSQGAPGWAITLLLYLSTRASRLAVAADVAAVQSSVHELAERLPQHLDDLDGLA